MPVARPLPHRGASAAIWFGQARTSGALGNGVEFRPFVVEVPPKAISDLRRRVSDTRWPDQIPGSGWDYGAEIGHVKDVCSYWANSYKWEAFVERSNAFPQFTTIIDQQKFHFIHARSPESTARPLLMLHGWPGSVAEFFEVIGPLSDPARYGGDPANAFHVIAPSLPGYGFSGSTSERGWNVTRTAAALAELMAQLGYSRFLVHGGDWGSLLASRLAADVPKSVVGVHLTILGPFPDLAEAPLDLSDSEKRAIDRYNLVLANESGYKFIQATKPQTLAYALTDSPAGLAGWIFEKFTSWSDSVSQIPIDRLLDNLSIYWLTGTIGSSMRMYYESRGPGREEARPVVTVPVGFAAFPGDLYQVPRRFVEKFYNFVRWTEMPNGGHFAAMETPELLINDVREFACQVL
jgi:pimeloyl-ACP methyl ester carboxylesterase